LPAAGGVVFYCALARENFAIWRVGITDFVLEKIEARVACTPGLRAPGLRRRTDRPQCQISAQLPLKKTHECMFRVDLALSCSAVTLPWRNLYSALVRRAFRGLGPLLFCALFYCTLHLTQLPQQDPLQVDAIRLAAEFARDRTEVELHRRIYLPSGKS